MPAKLGLVSLEAFEGILEEYEVHDSQVQNETKSRWVRKICGEYLYLRSYLVFLKQSVIFPEEFLLLFSTGS